MVDKVAPRSYCYLIGTCGARAGTYSMKRLKTALLIFLTAVVLYYIPFVMFVIVLVGLLIWLVVVCVF